VVPPATRRAYVARGLAVVLLLGIVASWQSATDYVRTAFENGKTAEARQEVRRMGERAVAAYARDGAVCPSASHPVPLDLESIVRMGKFQSLQAEWKEDEARHAGFACLGFEMEKLQYYQYAYEATPTSFIARARGDLDGDHVSSTFELHGHVTDGHLVVEPKLRETASYE